jgi:hypothetical protein
MKRLVRPKQETRDLKEVGRGLPAPYLYFDEHPYPSCLTPEQMHESLIRGNDEAERGFRAEQNYQAVSQENKEAVLSNKQKLVLEEIIKPWKMPGKS